MQRYGKNIGQCPPLSGFVRIGPHFSGFAIEIEENLDLAGAERVGTGAVTGVNEERTETFHFMDPAAELTTGGVGTEMGEVGHGEDTLLVFLDGPFTGGLHCCMIFENGWEYYRVGKERNGGKHFELYY